MSDLLTRMNDAVTNANLAANTTFQVLTGDLDVPVQVNGQDVPTLATRVRDYIDGMTASLDGADGVGIEYLQIRDQHLFVKLEGQSEADLGQVVPDEPNAVQSVVFDDTAGELTITLTDGTTFGPHNVNGADSVGIKEAFIDQGHLKIRMDDNTVLDAGDITRFGGGSVNDAQITEAGDLIVIYTDGTTQNLGRVRGDKGDNGDSVISGGIDTFGILRFMRNDGARITAGLVNTNVLDASGNTVDDVEINSDGELVLTLTSGELNLGQVVGRDGVDGVDGVGVQSYSATDGVLSLRLTNGTTYTVGDIQITRIFNQSDEVFVSEANIDADGNLYIDVTVGDITSSKNVGKVTGEDGTILSKAEINSSSQLILTDTEGNVLNAGTIKQATIHSVDVNADGYLVVRTTDAKTFTSTNTVVGTNGEDAEGIIDAYIDHDIESPTYGHMFVVFEPTSGIADADLGKILAPIETNATLANGADLTITLSDGQTFGPFNVRGDDGVYLVDAKIEDGELWVSLSDDPTTMLSLGKIDQDPVSATIETDGTLTLAFDDGTELKSVGRVGAFDGDTINTMTFDAETGDLTINYSTDNRTKTTSLDIPIVVGRSITDVTLDEETRELTIETNLDDGAGGFQVEQIDIPRGIDGRSVTSVVMDGNDLVITYEDENFDPVEMRAADVAAEGSIVDAYLNVDNNVEIVVDILDEPIILETIRGTDGNTIESIEFDGDDLVIITRDEGETRIPKVRGTDASLHITSVSVDGTDLLIEVDGDPDSPYRFAQLKGIDATETIRSMTLGGTENRDLIVEKLNETLTVPLLRGEDGITITEHSLTDTVLSISVSDGTEITFDLNDLAGIDGRSVTDIDLDPDTLDLTITTNLDAPDDVVVIPSVKGRDGIDGKNVDSIVLDGHDLVVTMDDGDVDASIDPTSYTISGVGAHLVRATLDEPDHEDYLYLEMSNGETIISGSKVRGRDGNGVGVVDIDFTDGDLTVTLAGADGVKTDVDAGSVKMISVTNARIEEDVITGEGILWLDQDNGESIEVGNVYGEDGRFISEVRFGDDASGENPDHLFVELNDGTLIDTGNSRGDDGRTVKNARVEFGGDLVIEYSDGTFDLVGNIGAGAGLSLWDTDEDYVKDQVVIYDGGLYMALGANSDEIPANNEDNWVKFAMGDELIEVRRPLIISPRDGNSSFTENPTLVASKYAPIVSIDERDHREFQIDLLSGDFSAPVETFSDDVDEYQIQNALALGESYKWRARDVSKRGYVSHWSEPQSFYVPEGVVKTPSVYIHADESRFDAFIAPNFLTTDFENTSNSDAHSETDWQIRRPSTGEIVWESLGNTSALQDIIIPHDVLEKGVTYEVRALHRAASIQSAWSNWFRFVVSEMDYIKQPSVIQGNDAATFVSSVFEKTDEFKAYTGTSLKHEASVWSVTRVDNGEVVVEETITTGNLREFVLSEPLEGNINYSVNVRYVTTRFGKVTGVAHTFFYAQSIETPTLSTDEDVNDFPNEGVIRGSAYVGVNESHVSSDWEVRDFYTNEVLQSLYNSTSSRTVFTLAYGPELEGRDVVVRTRYNGQFMSSEWSAVLDLHLPAPEPEPEPDPEPVE